MLARLSLVTAVLWLLTSPAAAERILVHDQDQYAAAAKSVEAGDEIVLANGEWRDFDLVITGKGSSAEPIIVTSQEAGKVVLTGQSSLRIGGEYIHVNGLVFRDGFSPRGEVISFRRNKEDLARHSRVSGVVVDGFSKSDRYESDYWVGIYGQNNRFDHNSLIGKTNKGVTLAVRLDSEGSRENDHRIEFNYFGPRPVLGSNGGETLRIGTSRYSIFNSNTVVANNIFDRTSGEVEIISSKSGGNIFRGNVFLRSRGTLTLRHGDNNVVEGNVFLGGGEGHTGGIRVINRGQTVRGNYMEGLRGEAFSSSLAIMNGVPNSPVNRYVEVEGGVIEGNTIVDSRRLAFNVGADQERSAAPSNTTFANNLMAGLEGESFIEVYDDISKIAFSNNVVGKGEVDEELPSFAQRPFEMERAENGLLYPVDPALADVGVSRALTPVTLEQVGASYYPKPEKGAVFGFTGNVIAVEPGDDTLVDAILAAQSGDVLELAPGDYTVERTISLKTAITIAAAPGAGSEKPVIYFGRPSLFELREGGNLKLENVVIDGALAPDSVGNSVIRTTTYPIKSNFAVEMHGVTVRGLIVNKSFNVLTLGKSTLADRVVIRNSAFADITGSIVSAKAETEDYGQYNVENLDISENTFARIGGPIADVYRGGRDESTFGPDVTIARNAMDDVGRASTNGSQASVHLHGVQIAKVSENAIRGSAPARVVHTVGTPKTEITNNAFAGTPALVLEELNFEGAHRAQLSGNEFATGGDQ
ncbi:MAG: polysaccharide lyase 6 family protein [Erythrobacter sp.]|uniref:polysaccharide lyase 6 family protein n=1 Tax=Erythrobacter sp. TaxID=1042 RepID=UPI0032637AE7